MPHLSTSDVIVGVVLAFVWAFLGYRLSEQARRTTGRTPWGLSSWLWAFFWFLSVILGLVLYLIYLGTRTGSARRGHPPTGGVPPPVAGYPTYPTPVNPTAPRPGGPYPGMPHPGPPRPAAPTGTRPPQPGAPVPGTAAPATGDPGAPVVGVAPPAPPANWYPDPSGRFHYRWWNGSQWTSQVSTNGQRQVDTHPDQRIGPT